MHLIDAGLKPNKMKNAVYDDKYLIKKFIELVIEIKKYPTNNELRMKYNSSKSFPFYQTYYKRFGRKEKFLKILIEYCNNKQEYLDANKIFKKESQSTETIEKVDFTLDNNSNNNIQPGIVYLMKSGKFYKIGLTKNLIRRERELKIQLPEALKSVHKIQTDDIYGIETYWHNRFKNKRKNGEWFELSKDDIKAFKMRRFM